MTLDGIKQKIRVIDFAFYEFIKVILRGEVVFSNKRNF